MYLWLEAKEQKPAQKICSCEWGVMTLSSVLDELTDEESLILHFFEGWSYFLGKSLLLASLGVKGPTADTLKMWGRRARVFLLSVFRIHIVTSFHSAWPYHGQSLSFILL